MSDYRRKKQKKGHAGLLIILLVIIALAGGCVVHFQMMTGPVNRSDRKTVVVEVPSGSTTDSIGRTLAGKGLIRSAKTFRLYSKLKHLGASFQAGTYSLSPSMSMNEIAGIIAEGKVTTERFTIPEGYNEYEVAKKLAKEGLVNRKKFVQVVQTKDFSGEFPFLKNAQKGKNRLEGYLFPDTYTVPLNAGEEEIVRTMLKGYQRTFTDAYRARAKGMGYSEQEILTIASIIERESGNEKDKPKIASVIYNRLKKNMPLQMDSTVQYVLKLRGKNPDKILYDDLKVDSKFNTYKNAGLPPSPICSPGAQSIRAALHPAKTKYLYFVVSDKLDGSSVFSEDYATFLKNSSKYHSAVSKK